MHSVNGSAGDERSRAHVVALVRRAVGKSLGTRPLNAKVQARMLAGAVVLPLTLADGTECVLKLQALSADANVADARTGGREAFVHAQLSAAGIAPRLVAAGVVGACELPPSSAARRAMANELGGAECALALVMVRGTPLVDVARSGSPDDVLTWSRGVFESVAAMHALSLVHGDVKPHNFVLVDGRVCPIDFGTTHCVLPGRPLRVPLVTTCDYAAPEVYGDAAGLHSPTTASDVYSAGATIRALAGHCASSVPVVAALLDVATRCCADDPRRRPSAADAAAKVMTLIDAEKE
jgi:hypothetical protein